MGYIFEREKNTTEKLWDGHPVFGRLTLSHYTTKPIIWPVRPAKTQIGLGIRSVKSESESSLSAWRKVGRSSPTLKTKTMIRLGGCTGWSESLLVAHVILLLFSCAGSFVNISQIQMTLLFPVNHVYRKLKSFSEKSKVNGVLCFWYKYKL